MHDPKIGEIITNPDAKRDAIHFAVAPVTAAHHLRPGDRVQLRDDGTATNATDKVIGIVDPFLDENVKKGDRFFLFLMPNTITSLRHAWAHPAFPDEQLGEIAPQNPVKATESRQWIEEFASSMGYTYDEVMTAANDLADDEWDYTYDNSEKYKDRDWEEFWPHWEQVTGRTKPEHIYGGAPYSCAC
ncbi:hypothetical protein [Inquilinus limosus]|uniref:Uncharacterized protein n=1 Tax=Inquilinus limosus MP06 TaxID=1398085 RepID=A0A0A0DBT5_9PROT|nr:hypothetical protein [Inquilinus limosus]KGM36176.1 hypothetical protein P409_00580 [Inquilinus limosus MP06]